MFKKIVIIFIIALAFASALFIYRGYFNNTRSTVSQVAKATKSPEPGTPEYKKEQSSKWFEVDSIRFKELFSKGKYADANKLIQSYSKDFPKNKQIIEYKNLVRNFMNPIIYKGPVEHIFFHPLMTYNLVKENRKGFDEFMVTIDEFNRTIEEFYKKDYVLIDIHLLYGTRENGTVYKKVLKIPKGKKPLVFSIDDYNFLQYMKENGCAQGLKIVDGKVLSYVKDKNGNKIFSDDKEITPIMENFVLEHPDFSYLGAKGVIALEGYEGALGFSTDMLSWENYPGVLAEARSVVASMKQSGWTFASHSYGHNSPAHMSYGSFVADANKWHKEVEAVVGKTDVYIYPFGERIERTDPKFKYLQKLGFRMFCDIWGSHPSIDFRETNIRMSRRNIDGIELKTHRLSNIIDDSKIPSPVRPWYNK